MRASRCIRSPLLQLTQINTLRLTLAMLICATCTCWPNRHGANGVRCQMMTKRIAEDLCTGDGREELTRRTPLHQSVYYTLLTGSKTKYDPSKSLFHIKMRVINKLDMGSVRFFISLTIYTSQLSTKVLFHPIFLTCSY